MSRAAVLEREATVEMKGLQQDALARGPPTEAAKTSIFSNLTPSEQEKPYELEVRGEIPKWLSGDLIRNGPGIFAPEHRHLFDGYALLVKFCFENGKVSTQQRMLQSSSWKNFEETGRIDSVEFGSVGPFLPSVWKIVKSLVTDEAINTNASVNTYKVPGKKEFIAMTETAAGTHRLGLDTLDTLERITYADNIPGDLTTAHPVIDPDGTLYNVFYEFGKPRCVGKIDPVTQQRSKIADVPCDSSLSPVWIHDLPGSQHNVIVPDTPVRWNIQGMLRKNAQFLNFTWEPGVQKTKFHVVPKKGGAVKTVEADFDYFAFHYATSYESPDGTEIYIDGPIFTDPDIINGLLLANMRSGHKSLADYPASYSRITVPLDGRKAFKQELVPIEQYTYFELPRINPNYKFKEYRYAYGISARLPTSSANALTKMDVKKGTSYQWFEPGCITNEPLMVPRPGATEEDDGIIASLVMGADGKSFLLILDAASFTEIARAQLPYGVAYGFHSQFYEE